MTNDQIAQLLLEHKVRPTAVRILVWRTLMEFDYAFALADLEGVLPTVDRSTLFRALSLFANSKMLHTLDDGTGQHKYCLCLESEETCQHESGEHHHELCQHVHVTCTRCGRTFCIKDQHIPQVALPQGFVVDHVSYIIRGLCPDCSHVK